MNVEDYLYFDSLQDGVLIADSEGVVQYANDSFGRITNLAVGRLFNKDSSNVLKQTPQIIEQIREIQAGTAYLPYKEYSLTWKDGTSLMVQSSARKFENQILVYIRDVDLEARLHAKYLKELESKESLILELDRKVFEQGLLLSVTDLGLKHSQENFPIDQVMDNVNQKVGTLGSFWLTLRETKELTYQVLSQLSFWTEPGQSQQARMILNEVIKFVEHSDPQNLFGEGQTQTLDVQGAVLLLMGSQTKSFDWHINVYVFSKENSTGLQANRRLLQLITQQNVLLLESQDLFRKSITDEKTGLFNQRYFKYRMDQEIKRVRRYGRVFSLLVVDIDHFKKFNDSYGHLVGDQVLVAVAQLIRSTFRVTDFTARYGGEEFVVICVETEMAGAKIVADRCRELIEKLVLTTADGKKLSVTVSIGVATYSDKYTNDTELFEAADKALYLAKNKGRNRIEMAPE